jgi:TolB protein
MIRFTLTTLLILASGFAPAASAKHKVFFNRFRLQEVAIMIADADGSHERPLVPHGTLEYSPSYSADGTWVVFTRETAGLSDVYRIHPDGSGLERLTDDPAFDDQGVLSPDGRTLAFVSTRGSGTANLWLLDLAAKTYTNLTMNEGGNFRPAWSPDGAWLAFSSDREGTTGVNPGHWELLQSTGIYVVRPDGTGLRRITRPGGVAGSPAWSPDGKSVLFYETDEVGAYMAKTARSRTEFVSVELSSGRRTLHSASNQTKLSPRFLDGGRIGFAIRSANADEEGIKIWSPDLRVADVVKGAARAPSWSPDGAHLVYERALRRSMNEHFIPTGSVDPEFDLYLSEPFTTFSPDGTRLLYSEQSSDGMDPADTSLAIMNADGSGKRIVYHRPGASAFDPNWSPAGDLILFSIGSYFRAPGFPPAQIATIKPDGTGFTPIVDDGANNGFPTWSPDGSQIVYKHGRQLVRRTLADGSVVPLTDGRCYDNFPKWQPHGDRILFTSDRDGRFELYTMRPDGSDVTRLTNVAGSSAHGSWSPDGQWIMFSSGRKGFKDEMAMSERIPQPYGELFVMHADGSGVRQLTDNKWEDAVAGWAPDTH